MSDETTWRAKFERLHALTEGDPTSIYAEAAALRGEVDGLRAENARLREALAAVLPTFDGDCYFDHHGDCQAHHADKIDGRCSVVVARETLAASLSETGGEA